MHNLKEDLLQFIWLHKLLKPLPLVTVSGKEIKLLKSGELNMDSGPDFFNAQIFIDGLTLAGNIEIHVKSSDWIKHSHQHDKNYDNLILHVVYKHDLNLEQNTNNNVEVLELRNLIPEGVLKKYSALIESKQTLACGTQFLQVEDLKLALWLERMYTERLQHKTDNLTKIFQSCDQNYSQTFYTLLLRNFGFNTNSLPFELLAKVIPVNTLFKHSDNLFQLEALLLGSAGLLDEQYSDSYVQRLQNEFEYLKTKYGIIPLKKEIFKFSKLRPANFATLRLAQFAKILHLQPQLFGSPHLYNSFEKIEACFTFETDGYWKNHYHLNSKEVNRTLSFGTSSMHNLIINTFSVFFFFYYRQTLIPQFENTALELLEKCGFEKNKITKMFPVNKQLFKSAVESQALINLNRNYCSKKKCLSCGVAASILKTS